MNEKLPFDNAQKEVAISIIMATFNAEKVIEECLQSIIAQSFKSIEIIVVDGDSVDATISILKKYEGYNVRWISERDKGIYDALNKGIKLAKGKWLYFMGADDRLLPGFSELAKKLTKTNTIYYGNSEEWFTSDERPPYILLKGKFSKYRLAKYCINHQAILYPAAAFKKNSYNLKYKIFADYCINIQLWGDGDFKKQFFPITIARYNMNGVSSIVKDEAFKKDKPALIKKYLGKFVFARFLLKRYKKKWLSEEGFE